MHRFHYVCITLLLAVAAAASPSSAFAAGFDGAALSWPWSIPFAGLLLSIATGPLLAARLWHRHYGKIALAWSALTLAPIALAYGVPTAAAALMHALVGEYMSFIALLFALYVVAGGILVVGDLRGTPATNVALLALGTAMASVVGTTGAAMILIRPLLRANAGRPSNAHVVVFFIILVANVGGALSPLGDPPLFVGYLRGVDFFWTTRALAAATALVAAIVLALFVLVDLWFARRDGLAVAVKEGQARAPLRLRGLVNVGLIGGIIAAILVSGVWRPAVVLDAYGTAVPLQNLVRDLVLFGIAVLSLWVTPDEHRAANGFTWEPIVEVAKLFAAIFVCIIPVLAMLQAGRHGAFAWLVEMVSPNGRPDIPVLFWATGLLSAFLDNAPTYLVFFEAAGGDPQRLMGELAPALAAISMGAVYMGALSYIGNAPNFMIYAIAVERGVRMPSFFAYAAWSGLILLPVFALLTLSVIGR